jgi:hypothetical protein
MSYQPTRASVRRPHLHCSTCLASRLVSCDHLSTNQTRFGRRDLSTNCLISQLEPLLDVLVHCSTCLASSSIQVHIISPLFDVLAIGLSFLGLYVGSPCHLANLFTLGSSIVRHVWVSGVSSECSYVQSLIILPLFSQVLYPLVVI